MHANLQKELPTDLGNSSYTSSTGLVDRMTCCSLDLIIYFPFTIVRDGERSANSSSGTIQAE